MRIKIINPNTTVEMTDDIREVACSVARPDTTIVAVSSSIGPVSIDTFHDEFAAAIGVMEEVHLGVKEKFDAFIIACYGDPGLYAAREIAAEPVIGIAEASMYLAGLVAAKFSIITDTRRSRLGLEELVCRYGMKDRCVSIREASMSVLELSSDMDQGMRQLVAEGKKALNEDGAETLCLGCAGMGKYVSFLEKKLGVPVFDGVACAVKLAESLVELGKKTSKVLYFNYPRKKEYKGYLAGLQP